MRHRHEVIPVPKVVLDRQENIRYAREATSKMYGVPAIPYTLDTPEYRYFVERLWDKYTA